MTITGKSVQIVEMDLDVYRATQFELDNAYEDIKGWTSQWDADCTLKCMLDDDAPAGKAADLRVTGTDDLHYFSFDIVPDIRDASAVLGFKPEATSADIGIILRGSGSDGSETGYLVEVSGGDTVGIAKIVNGSTTNLTSGTFDYEAGDIVWIRFDAIDAVGIGSADSGVTLRAKAWVGALEDEPESFMISTNDASDTIDEAGGSGIFAYTGAGAISFFRVRSYLSSAEETHRYVLAANYVPTEYDAIPNILSINQTPATLSLGENLGTRAQVQIEFTDHPHSENGEFFRNGTYWGRFRAREIFRRGQPLRVKTGFLGTELDDYENRHYYLDKFTGPNSDDSFTITAQDLLKFVDNDRAQAPRANTGSLTGTLASDGSSFSVTSNTGSEYSSSGYVAIGGKEIIAYTRSGDNFTVTARAQFGTTAIEHSSQDRVQQCLYYNGESPADILKDLFEEYADIDTTAINYSTWVTECDTYLQRQYTRLIPEPTGVGKLAEELIQQAGLVLWWDNIDRLIKLQVLRGIVTETFEYNEENIISDTIQVEEQRDKLITEVWTYYGVRNPLESLSEANNYRSLSILTDGEKSTLNGSAVIKKIFATWIPTFGAATADRTNSLHAGRFNKPPRRINFSIPRNAEITLPREAGGYQFKYHNSQNEFGKEITIPIQVTKVEPLPDRVRVEAEEMLFEQFDPGDLVDRVITIDSDINNFDLRITHDQIYPDITDDTLLESPIVTLTCIINSGVVVGSNSTGTPAFKVGSWPVGFKPKIIIRGRVQGKGGDGGWNSSGHAGGTAFYTRHPIDLDSSSGAIWGGGGGGGATIYEKSAWQGGGGAGTLPGVGLPPGTATSGGSSSAAGDGGGPGQPGGAQPGTVGYYSGGSAGRAIDGKSYITELAGTGDRRGGQIN